MSDIQIMTMSVTLLGIFAASWFNNSRIGDVKDVIRAEMNLQFERTNNKIDALLKLVADIDQRVTKLEARS